MNVDGQTAPEQVLDVLVDARVLDHVGEDLTSTDAFADDLQRLKDRTGDLDRKTLRLEVISATESETETDSLLEVTEKTPSIAAEYLALAERTDLSHLDRLQALSLFDMFFDPPPDAGTPGAFAPVSGHRLPFHVALRNKALVYVWRHDCPPCESVCDNFNEIFDEPLEDLALFAVYGPDTAAKLYEWYGVIGGPATLFFHQGEVEARMYGAYNRSVFETEIERHRRLG